ncbi:MAG TPA: MFS transporter [Bacteroidales bacterium]|nr:MFS transporter [Bacteroidales bacterium]
MENNKTRIGNYRWVIITLLLFSTTINYMDRQVISYLKPFFCTAIDHGGFGWNNSQFSFLTSFFLGVYALVSIFAGRIIDKIGTKLGLAISLVIWSIFGMVNALASAALAVNIFIRSLFAVGEAGVFPVSIKTVAEWFPKKERALATGIFNSGTNIGAMIAALFVPWCIAVWGDNPGWKWAFILTGASGFIFLIFWLWLYNPPGKYKKLTKAEADYIHQDDTPQELAQVDDKANIPFSKLLKYRQTWSFFWGKFLTDGVWWFYLFWLPDYLMKQFGMSKLDVRWPTFIVYGVAIIGSVFGGSIPLFLINRGMPVYKARMRAMLMIAVVPLVVLTTQYFGNVARFGNAAIYLAVAVICIAAAGHQAWSANLFTTVSDMFPKKAVGSMVGIGTMAGGIGGILIQLLSGKLNDVFSATPQTAYLIMFCICALGYLIAWSLMKGLVPQHKPITDL